MLKVIISVAGLGLFSIAAYGIYLFLNQGEIGEKPTNAILQQIEFEDRSSNKQGPSIRRVSGYFILGIPGVGEPSEGPTDPPASRRAWLILNEHSTNRQVRKINAYPRYDLSCAYVENLERDVPDVDDYVIGYLRTLCK